MAEDTVNYRATSVFSDLLVWATVAQFAVSALALPEVVAIVPTTWMPAIVAVSSVIQLALRFYKVVRPVAFIKPGETMSVAVRKL